jgi:hypothetical protein
MALAGAVCITPWSIRNSLLAGRPVIMRGGGGSSLLYLGNHPGATGDMRDGLDKEIWLLPGEEIDGRSVNELHHHMYHTLGETEFRRVCRERARQFIRENPDYYAWLVGRRAVTFWLGDFSRTIDWSDSLDVGFSLLRLKQAQYLLLTVLAAAGLAVALWRRWVVWPLVGQMAAYALPYMLIYCGLMRYRVPITGSLILLGSVAVWAGSSAIGRRLGLVPASQESHRRLGR